MKRVALLLLPAALCLVLAPSAALAKGPSEASVAGPGLSDPVALSGDEGSGPLGEVTEAAGFFPAVFRQVPNPMLESRPAGTLGPRYVVTYVVPGPNNERDVLRQDIYPYAEPAPISYMEPGQTVFGTERTFGGWFVGSRQLREVLVAAGLPREATTGVQKTTFPWAVVAGLGALVAVFGLGALAIQLLRRQPRSAT